MPTVSEVNVKFSATGTADVDKAIDHIDNSVTGLGKRLGSVLSTAGGFLLAQGIGMAANAMGGLISTGLDFEKQMANVNSILQLSDAGIKQLSDQVLALAQNPGITDTPAQLAAGLYEINSSGFSGADGLMILESSAIAATAGMTTTDVAARAAAAVLNAYGLEASEVDRINNAMFQTVNDGVITYEELANNMGTTLPLANALGVSFEQLAAAYALQTTQGIGASAAETNLAGLMKSALNPTEALTAAVQEHGYATAEALLSGEGLPGYLDVLTEASGGTNAGLFELLGTQEAVNAALALGGDNADAYTDEIDRMNHASDGAGAMNKALEKQMKSASFQIAKAKQEVAILATMFVGQFAPAIAGAASGVTSFISDGVIPFVDVLQNAFNSGTEFQELIDDFPKPLQRTVHAFGSLADSVGDLYRSFQAGGLQGMFDTLLDGGEGEQIIGALSAIGQEAWDGFKGTLLSAASTGVDIGIVTVKGLIELGGDLLSASITGIKDWVMGKIYGQTDPGGTGGPEPFGDIPPITLKDIVIQGGIALMGGISEIAGNLHDWLQGKIFGTGAPDGTGGPEPGGGSGFVYEIASVTLNVLEGIANISAGQVSQWIQDQINTLTDISASLESWGIIITGAPEVSDGTGEGGDGGGGIDANLLNNINAWLQEKSDDWNGENGLLIDATNWTFKVTGHGDPQIDDMTEWNTAMQELVQAGLDDYTDLTATLNTWILKVGNPSDSKLDFLDSDLVDTIVGLLPTSLRVPLHFGLDVLFSDDDVKIGPIITGEDLVAMNAVGGSSYGTSGDEGGGMFSGIWDTITGGVSDLIGQITGSSWGSEITLAIVDAITPGDLTTIVNAFQPVIDALKGIWGTVDGWVTNILDRSNDADEPHAATGGTGGGGGSASPPLAGWPGGGGGGGLGVGFAPDDPFGAGGGGLGFGGANHAFVVPAPDLTQFNTAVATIPTVLGQAMSDALSAGSTYGAAIGLVIGDQFINLQTGVTTSMTGVTVAVGQGMSDALSASFTYASAINTVVSGEFATMVSNVTGAVNTIPGVISSALSSAALTAYGAGLAVGQGLANGMSAMTGEVYSAAAALAAAASAGANNALERKSPSKVFRRIGEDVGEGFVLGIESMFGSAGQAGAGLAGSSIPTIDAFGSGGYGRGVVQEVHHHHKTVVVTVDSDKYSEVAREALKGGAFASTVAAASKN